MAIELIDPVNDKRWYDFIAQSPSADIFHHPGWLRVLGATYRFKIFSVCSISGHRIQAGIPFCETSFLSRKSWKSLPFSDYCKPLWNQEDNIREIENYLLDQKALLGLDTIEIRAPLPDYSRFKSTACNVVHQVRMSPEEELLFKSFKRQVRQNINKSVSAGLKVENVQSLEGIEQFYRLHLLTRKKLGVPIQPKKYFHLLHAHLIARDLATVLLVRRGDRIIGAGVFLYFNKTFCYKYSASDPDHLRLRPNDLLTWEGMREAISRGFSSFCFGRTPKSNPGLIRFKSGWSEDQADLPYSYYPEVKNGDYESVQTYKLLSRVIKASPPFVCSFAGNILYRFAA
jgi:hypothetical protein